MKKFELSKHDQSVKTNTDIGKFSKIIEILPNIMQFLPKLLGNKTTPPTENEILSDIYYPSTPTVAQFKATQIRNTMDSIKTHQYLVSKIRENNVISGSSPLFQQIDTLPSTLHRQHHQD